MAYGVNLENVFLAAMPGIGDWLAALGELMSTRRRLRVPLLRSQSEELRESAKLAMEAAELIFEMTAMGDSGENVKEMVQNAKQLQARLRSSERASPSTSLCC